MKKLALILVPLCLIFASCSKQINPKLIFSVSTYPDSILHNVYIPDSGTYSMPIQVKFLTGNTDDAVSIWLTGVPSDVKVTPDSFSAKPSYVRNFVFTTKNAARGTYPITIAAYTSTIGTRYFTFDLIVVPFDCASLFWGSLNCNNACNTKDYTFTASGVDTRITNELTINNFGGYGTNVNVNVFFNAQNGVVTIPHADYGNGTVLSGSGSFNTNMMIIYYTATSTPTGISESCTDTIRNH